ncbi:hypothetical protein GUITHDRAFT_121232 [Guillardia theta CCMP2712]|uniref:Uncharacterized protein n=1 Tax=Guillardia theta (strain CCMP2712) TaxID=905079 RepID=L1I918_GUITC|nr:hypothetical protein GUITHDRAFT_121232 [Guillardia theta CCMP2712]EKX32602.1 hypothetical protein GUITHDRAFT_121232 [Guillardia theta CCMP2712]|eukprot:XP_005819582.1 hypothetical protein GUITHDRAFT_121232 [Guillardia theta CCMP2712]
MLREGATRDSQSADPGKLYAYVEPSKDKKLSALHDSIALIRSNARVVSATELIIERYQRHASMSDQLCDVVWKISSIRKFKAVSKKPSGFM